MPKELVTCKNCDNDYQQGFSFCPHCGQQTQDDLTLGVLFYNTISNYFSFDARFLKGFIPLMFKPGFLPKKFIEGKRLVYLHPGQMYLFVAFIFFFVFSFYVNNQTRDLDEQLKNASVVNTVKDSIPNKQQVIDSINLDKIKAPLLKNKEALGLKYEDIEALDSITKMELKSNNSAPNLAFNFNERKVDSLIAIGASDDAIYKAMGRPENPNFFTKKFFEQMLKFYREKGVGSIMQTFYDSLPIALFFMLPIFALLLKLFYYKRGRYAHHLVFSLYYFSFLFTAFMLIYLFNLLLDLPSWIGWLVALSTYFYFYLAAKRFYGNGWFLTWFKTSVVTFLYLMVVTPFALVILGFLSFMFY
ncbi:DUF3667 domain-containing protein [Ichthyenterobacterium sp. W332]|uniref:DUF3667 domain-containing protein n=1 Tax=Microcosmobacter mediterraneus TaxID=3075607 RepID=A0ABU2YLC0_9FLAO|nr:DUF3667 domain-containing protein [Ichthyenterobacterium sp. W332]MDT0558630.1 DUF3667 domain-containing protein [Ichthyenterobacterium sp. W332]